MSYQLKNIKFALRLAKDCTYSDLMTDGAKDYLRNAIDIALKEVESLFPSPDNAARTAEEILRNMCKSHMGLDIHPGNYYGKTYKPIIKAMEEYATFKSQQNSNYKQVRSISVDFGYYLHATKQAECSHEKHKEIFDEWASKKGLFKSQDSKEVSELEWSKCDCATPGDMDRNGCCDNCGGSLS